jgi:DNA processing protein
VSGGTKSFCMNDDLFTAAPLPIAPLGPGERLACLRLIRTEQIGPATFRQLINHYGGATAALDAIPVLARRGGRKRPLKVFSRDAAQRELEAAERLGLHPVFTIEPGYPKQLAWLDQPPPLVYTQGQTALLERPAVAVVGSRRSSAAGQALARTLAAGLSQAGIVVVSGLARGIDAAAHQAALPHGTIAVLAGGLDNVYPPENEALQREIAVHGCLISERPPGFTPRGRDFPRRNRIISGLSLGVVVVEAAQRSGSLITARMALEQGRTVYAVPGHPLDPRAEGTNRLIKAGATMVTAVSDILSDLAPQLDRPTDLRDGSDRATHQPDATQQAVHATRPPPLPPPELNDTDRHRVLEALGTAPVGLDELIRATGLTAQSVQIALLEISLAGRLEPHGHNLFSLRPIPPDDGNETQP